MRKITLAMMTTLNCRLDDPDAWMDGLDDEQYSDILEAFERFDTVVVGRVTFEEMAAYWPGAETDRSGSATNRSMAHRMNTYRKYVLSSNRDLDTSIWTNAELVPIRGDEDVIAFARDVRARPGKNIHLAGGARLAQTFARLGLVDEYRLAVYPIVSPGACLFDAVPDNRRMALLESRSYDNGVMRHDYAVADDSRPMQRPRSFTETARRQS